MDLIFYEQFPRSPGFSPLPEFPGFPTTVSLINYIKKNSNEPVFLYIKKSDMFFHILPIKYLSDRKLLMLILSMFASKLGINVSNISYDECLKLLGVQFLTETQKNASCHLLSGRCPHDSTGVAHLCAFYSYGGRGYGHEHCIGFCQNSECIQTIRMKALQTIRVFVRYAKTRFIRRRMQILLYKKALQTAGVDIHSSIFAMFLLGKGSLCLKSTLKANNTYMVALKKFFR
jgi:hypothetical protein